MKTKISTAIYVTLTMLFFAGSMFAQPGNVGINDDGSNPNHSAMLDVKSTSKGLLIPNVELRSTNDIETIQDPALSLLVYNTAIGTGVTPGFYYWNGSVWAALAGIAGSGFSHYIGELYGGGIVAAVWKEAGIEKGLIASLVDLQTSGASYTMAWSGNTTDLIGATAQSPFDGQANTTAIIGQDGTADKAATVCDVYTNTETGTGVYSDWYLPAAWELTHCYNAAFVVNTILGAANGFQPANYWSSTKDSIVAAYCRNFTLGTASSYAKNSNNRVRAVRRF